MAAPYPNVYHKRLVAEASSKPCFICYKPVTVVLITPDNKDFFYICPGHLNDRGFATPADGHDEASKVEAARKKELEEEIEKVKKEYAEKQKKRKEKGKKKDDGGTPKDKKGHEDEDAEEEKEKNDRIGELEKRKAEGDAPKVTDNGPRIFTLNKAVYQMRLNRLKAARDAKKTRELVRDPLSFPSVPNAKP